MTSIKNDVKGISWEVQGHQKTKLLTQNPLSYTLPRFFWSTAPRLNNYMFILQWMCNEEQVLLIPYFINRKS